MGITQKEFEQQFVSLLDKMKEIVISKNHDYAGVEDPLANLRMCEKAGIPAWVGITSVRMADKLSRIMNFARTRELKVKSESVKDTLLDLANYCLIAYIAYEDSEKELQEQSKQVSSPKLVTG